jgi:hypothetical protein
MSKDVFMLENLKYLIEEENKLTEYTKGSTMDKESKIHNYLRSYEMLDRLEHKCNMQEYQYTALSNIANDYKFKIQCILVVGVE